MSVKGFDGGGSKLWGLTSFLRGNVITQLYYLYPFLKCWVNTYKKSSKIGHGALELWVMTEIKKFDKFCLKKNNKVRHKLCER
jgi:hypothetical protein